MYTTLTRHRRQQLVGLITRLLAQLDVLEAIPGPARKLPMPGPLRGPAKRLLADAARLVPLPADIARAPTLPGELQASTLVALVAIKHLLRHADPARQEAYEGTFRRGSGSE